FVDHQHLVDTFETNLRGPVKPLYLAGRQVRAILPIAVNPGNVGVSFDVLSYAGTLGITVVSDPDSVPDLTLLTRLLASTLTRLCESSRPSAPHTSQTSVHSRTLGGAPDSGSGRAREW